MKNDKNNSAVRITLVEDNQFLLKEYLFQLQYLGFNAKGCRDAVELDQMMHTWESDIYILDINLPGEDGFSIAKRLYHPTKRGIILLSARTEIDDRCHGLAEGADVYLTKPVNLRELGACVDSLYRRLSSQSASKGGWVINAAMGSLSSPDGRFLELRPQEMRLLLLLIKSKNICARVELVNVFDLTHLSFSEGRINTMVWRLRTKLQAFDSELVIKTSRNSGYSYAGPSIQILE